MAVYDLKALTGIIENERARSKQYIQDAKERKKESKAIETQMNLAKMQIDASMEKLNMQIKENRLLNEENKQENRYLKELELIANEIATDQSLLLDTKNKLNTKITESSENLLAYNSIPEESKSFKGEELATNTDDFRTNLINREKNQQAKLEHQSRLLNELNSVITKAVDFKNVFATTNPNPRGGKITREDLSRRGYEWLNANVPNYHEDNPQHKLWSTIFKSSTSEAALLALNSNIEGLKKNEYANQLTKARVALVNAQKNAKENPNSADTLKYKTDVKKYKDLYIKNWTTGEHSTANVIKGLLKRIQEGNHEAYNEFKDAYKNNFSEEWFETLEKQADAFFTSLKSTDNLYLSFASNSYNILESSIKNGQTVGEMLFLDAYNVIKAGINDIDMMGGFTDAPAVVDKGSDLTEEERAQQALESKGYIFK